ncbi:MAG: transcription termination factor Rho [Actinomycetaceae bacterium]|nr:transcription termination factor Rho [Actinomycetaceae bacterium]
MSENPTPKKRALSTMRLAELREVADEMGLKNTSKMRKQELLATIREARGEKPRSSQKKTTESAPSQAEPRDERKDSSDKATPQSADASDSSASASTETPPRKRRRRAVSASAGSPETIQLDVKAELQAAGQDTAGKSESESGRKNAKASDGDSNKDSRQKRHAESLDEIKLPSADADADEEDRDRPNRRQNNRNRSNRDDRDDRGGRRRRGRDRNKRRGRDRDDREPEIREDDVLIPIGGILDVQDNHAFVRTSGYLPGPNDVYVTLGNVRRWKLRPGDAITGAVRQPREGERQRQKYNALVRLDTVNGMTQEEAAQRREFGKLTPLYPTELLRLETTPKAITPRVIDLVSPIGKGQRGLIVSPPKAGKTIVMQQIANAISQNNPEVHLMVVLVDERPEEVTDMERTVKGEVIASTFDRPASDHTMVAELAIERAKRLVELGHDVVILLDSLTRLSRAYNLAAPASGRILSGGVDASALYPPKRFFGAARNIEDGGSLTIIASALIETGSKMDEVIFEEFKGTGNMELRLARELANRRIFPAVDVNASGTRREEVLFTKEQLAIMWRLRRVLGTLEQQQALELVLDKLKDTQSNAEFLMSVAKTTPMD